MSGCIFCHHSGTFNSPEVKDDFSIIWTCEKAGGEFFGQIVGMTQQEYSEVRAAPTCEDFIHYQSEDV